MWNKIIKNLYAVLNFLGFWKSGYSNKHEVMESLCYLKWIGTRQMWFIKLSRFLYIMWCARRSDNSLFIINTEGFLLHFFHTFNLSQILVTLNFSKMYKLLSLNMRWVTSTFLFKDNQNCFLTEHNKIT